MKKLVYILSVAALFVLIFLVFSVIERPQSHELPPTLKFGFWSADNPAYYAEMKRLGISYVLISNFSEEDAVRRIDEAGKEGLKVYVSAGTLHPDDFKRMEILGNRSEVEGFALDEPHLHKSNYDNSDIERWIGWSKEKFPGKKVLIATPRIETYEELLNIPNLHLAGFQPDYYPIYGAISMYGSQRRLAEKIERDGFEIQPIIQTHGLAFYESGTWRNYIDAFASLRSNGLTSWPTPREAADQIRNVASPNTNIIWMYPGEDTYVRWTPERKEYIKEIFQN